MELLQQIQRVLERTPLRRVRRGLGGSHTVVTYPPLDALDELPVGAEEPFQLVPPQGTLHYYLHIAFCEHICDFCHYTKTRHTPGHPSPEAADYVPALLDEAAERRRSLAGSDIGSIYVGGGTPTALDVSQLRRVTDLVRSLKGETGAAVCFEVSPITLDADDGRAKLDMLVAAGATRLSLGVQTFEPSLLPRLRGHDQPLLLRVLDMLKTTSLTLNLDLIQDLACQTRESLENDLRFVERYRTEQVTWYVLRAHTASSFAKRLRSGAERPVDDVESALRRAQIIEGMERLGYVRQPGGRFTLKGTRDGYKAVRGGVDSHLLGLGVSSYSHGWGWFFRNVTNVSARNAIREYVHRIKSGRSATASALRVTDAERFAGQLCQLSREFIPADMVAGDDPAKVSARTKLNCLAENNLMRGDAGSGWRPTELGWLFEEEIASLFYSAEVRRRLKTTDAYWVTEHTRATRQLGARATTENRAA